MCKYISTCKLCNHPIAINVTQKNMQDAELTFSSDCPNLKNVANKTIVVDVFYELVTPKTKSKLYKLLSENGLPDECTAYENIVDAIGRNLGRYYELA